MDVYMSDLSNTVKLTFVQKRIFFLESGTCDDCQPKSGCFLFCFTVCYFVFILSPCMRNF